MELLKQAFKEAYAAHLDGHLVDTEWITVLGFFYTEFSQRYSSLSEKPPATKTLRQWQREVNEDRATSGDQ